MASQKRDSNRLESIDKLLDELAQFKYGVPEKTQTIKEMLHDKNTSCWGISRLAFNRLRRAGLDPTTVYMREEDNDRVPTHQFTIYPDGDQYRMFDYFNDENGLDLSFKTIDDLIKSRVNSWKKNSGGGLPVSVYIGKHIPRPGKGFEEYMSDVENKNDFFGQY